ncbi:MAG: hypothetical protein K2K14_08475 [Ruminococcus sp.]|nr:hypothetical protein [Ruminococcus sp.]
MQKSNNKFMDFIVRIACDPVLIYTVIIMMSIMYHYKSEHTLIYGIVSFVITGLSFRLFDYMKKHKFIGTIGYIALFLIFMYAVGFAQKNGENSYPLSFGIWFLTPQDVLDYSQWYTIEIFLLFQLFMMSVIYYFTRIRYRIFMGFLIFIIPFAIYGKEFEKMPIYFIILLAVSYILIMIDFRQMQNTEETEIIDKKTIWKSIASYAVVFAAAAAIIPKPEIEANRDFLDTLISAEQFTDRLTAMLSVFRDDTDGEQFRTNSNTPLYYVKANEPMRLKTTTFSAYNYNNDSWSVEDSDRNFVRTFESGKESVKNGLLEFSETGSITKAILYTAGLDSEFAEKYGFEGYSENDVSIPESKWVSITSNVRSAQFAPVPPLVQNFWYTSYQNRMALIESGLIYADNSGSRSGHFAYDEKFVFSYTPDTFFINSTNKSVTDKFSDADYETILSDALEILENESGHDEKVQTYINQLQNEIDDYKDNRDILLDYGDSQMIYGLAQEITAGYSSDYDKAKAIEAYFRNNDYIYDLDYRKGKGDNVEDFIFNAKRGVCYEYATAMVLLARSVGIPARYCEGYNMSQLYNNRAIDTNFIVTGNDAHGFPELYIRGFGWLSFEPTVSNDEITEQGNTTADSLARAGLIILLTALVVIICIFLYPVVSHKLFIFRYRKKSPNEAVSAIMCRTCRVFGISRGYTSQETAQIIYSEWNADIYGIAEMFDRAVYGEAVLNDIEREKAMEEYIAAYEAYKEKKRKRNKKIKNLY